MPGRKRDAALSAMTPAIYEFDLQATCEALAPAGRGGFGRLWAALTSARYRAARANAAYRHVARPQAGRPGPVRICGRRA